MPVNILDYVPLAALIVIMLALVLVIVQLAHTTMVVNGKQYRQMREMLQESRNFNMQLLSAAQSPVLVHPPNTNGEQEEYNLFNDRRSDEDEAEISKLRES